ncbi:MAG: hypothetical protein K2X82_05745, partial [Gemmataceae bacterium]|nr:hypothetical protein [Gemmataceae bacterium]
MVAWLGAIRMSAGGSKSVNWVATPAPPLLITNPTENPWETAPFTTILNRPSATGCWSFWVAGSTAYGYAGSTERVRDTGSLLAARWTPAVDPPNGAYSPRGGASSPPVAPLNTRTAA